MDTFRLIVHTFVLAAAVFLLILFNPRYASAKGVVYRGVFRNIPVTQDCSNQPASEKLILILNGAPDSATAGMYYSSESSPGRLRRTATGVFEIIDPVTEILKLKPTVMHLSGSGEKLRIVIEEQQVNDPALKDWYCWNKIPPFTVKLAHDNPEWHKKHAEELYAEELMLLEGRRLLYEEDDYTAALVIGRKVLQSMERRLHDATSKKALIAVDLVLVPLMHQERFDEVLLVIKPFCKAFPKHKSLGELEQVIRTLKAEQDALFQYDPDKDDGVKLEPIG